MSPDIKGGGNHSEKNKSKGEDLGTKLSYNNVRMEILTHLEK